MRLLRTWFVLTLSGLLVGLGSQLARAQQADEVWTQFEVKTKDDSRFGYRDASGRVRLPPKFGTFTNARRFRHIMAVSEADAPSSYYLLKNGRVVGRDSVYMSGDYEVACESEGAILFRDRKKDRVGFFDVQGRVLIPAAYNYATPFHNGLSVALAGARRACWERGGDTLTCEHLGWTGGRQVLLNQYRELVAELPANLRAANVDWYSLRRNAPAPDTATTVTLPAVNGDRLTFTAYNKEFQQWFFGLFVPVVRSGAAPAITSLCFREVTTAGRPFQGWSHGNQAAFVAKFRLVLQARLGAVRRGTPGLAVFDEPLNTAIYTGPLYQQYLTDCGEPFSEKYPVFEVVLTYPTRPANAPVDHQAHFGFIRTAGGYRLLSVAL